MIFTKDDGGFTLIELIVVIAIITLLASIVFVVLDPSTRFGDTKDTVRKSNALAIENAIEKAITKDFDIPVDMTALVEDTPYMLVTEGSATSGLSNCNTLDIAIAKVDIVDFFKDHLGNSIPIDENAVNDDTGYYLKRYGNNFFIDHCNAFEDEFDWDCGDTLADLRDAKTYDTILIGTQCWMAENINVGTMVTGVSGQWDNATLEKFCYDDSEVNCTSDGALYEFNEASNYFSIDGCNGTGEGQPACTTPIQGICPDGWHVPSHYEFVALEREVCTSGTCATDFPYDETTVGYRGTDEGTALKVGGSSGFDIILAGDLTHGDVFERRSTNGYFWTATEFIGPEAWNRDVSSAAGINRRRDAYWESYGFSVRCALD